MSLEVATRAIDFAFRHTPANEDIEIGFFGGEPLLEFPLLVEITNRIESDDRYNPCRVKLSVTTNGTLLTAAMLEFFDQHRIAIFISCDGPPTVHNRFRHFADGSDTSDRVESAIRMTLAIRGRATINAVYGPETLTALPETLDYLSSLGVRQIHLNPNFSSRWNENDVEKIPSVYQAIANRYARYYRDGQPHFISLVDNKITVMLRGGYQEIEKCRMGKGEFAFTPLGQVYPCERLAGTAPKTHAIGSVNDLVQIGALQDHFAPGPTVNEPCTQCSIRDYCVNWCGCSNYFMSGYYNRVSPFLCMSERTALRLAAEIFQTLEPEFGYVFLLHLGEPGRITLHSTDASGQAHPTNALPPHHNHLTDDLDRNGGIT